MRCDKPIGLIEFICVRKVMVGDIDMDSHTPQVAEVVANTLRTTFKLVAADKP